MKRITLFAIICIVSCATPTHAQFFKKLKKKVEQSVENTVTDKVANKASEETSKGMDEVLEPDFSGSTTQGDVTTKDTYHFDWVYRLEMNTQRQDEALHINYHLKKDADYWGARFQGPQMEQQDMFMVYDYNTMATIIFMNSGGMKMAMTSKLPKDIVDSANENSDMESYTITKIPGKTIMGYECDGFKMENDEHVFTSYITFDAPVGFGDMFNTGKKMGKNMPKGFNPEWLMKDGEQGLMMEMDMVDKNKSKNNMTMTCTKLEKESFSISKSDYKSF